MLDWAIHYFIHYACSTCPPLSGHRRMGPVHFFFLGGGGGGGGGSHIIFWPVCPNHENREIGVSLAVCLGKIFPEKVMKRGFVCLFVCLLLFSCLFFYNFLLYTNLDIQNRVYFSKASQAIKNLGYTVQLPEPSKASRERMRWWYS